MFFLLIQFFLKSNIKVRYIILFVRDDGILEVKFINSIKFVKAIDAPFVPIWANKKSLNEINTISINTTMIYKSARSVVCLYS